MSFIPRPISDLIAPFAHTAKINKILKTSDRSTVPALKCLTREVQKYMDRDMIHAVLRTALAAGCAFALYKLGGSLAVAATVGALASLPTVALAGGSYLLYLGGSATIAAVSSGSFSTLGIGLATLAAGWITLEYHDLIPLGIIDQNIIQPLANAYANIA